MDWLLVAGVVVAVVAILVGAFVCWAWVNWPSSKLTMSGHGLEPGQQVVMTNVADPFVVDEVPSQSTVYVVRAPGRGWRWRARS